MGLLYSVSSASVTLSASATKTLWLLNPTDTLKVVACGISFDSSAAATAPRVELYRTTTLGSPAGTTTTPVRWSSSADEAADATALTNLTTEPTAVEILKPMYVQPFGGDREWWNPLGQEAHMSGTLTQRIGLRVITAASVTPSAVSWVLFDE